MRYIVGAGSYDAEGGFTPQVVVDMYPLIGGVEAVWPYDGDDEMHAQVAADLRRESDRDSDLSIGQVARLVAGNGIAVAWEDFDPGAAGHPSGPWR